MPARTQSLVSAFVSSAKSLLARDGGTIILTHKTKPPYNQWRISDVVESAGNGDIKCVGRVVFDKSLFHPYVNRKALDRKSFPCADALMYFFQVRSRKPRDENGNGNGNGGEDEDEDEDENEGRWGESRGLSRLTSETLSRLRDKLLGLRDS